MNTVVTLNPLGFVIAALFLAAMGSLFWWMFHVPPLVPQRVVQVRQTVSALRRILVPIVDVLAAERAVELACRLGEFQKAEIILVHVMEVPFTLALDASLPDQEASAQAALTTARFIVSQHGLPSRQHVLRRRQAADGILEVAKAEDVSAIVMSTCASPALSLKPFGRTVQEVVRKSPYEVILDQAPACNYRGYIE
jgi:nucleotide-binding universal stress UspA family protein